MDFVCLFSIIIMETWSRNQIRIYINTRKNNTHSYPCSSANWRVTNMQICCWCYGCCFLKHLKHSVLGDSGILQTLSSKKILATTLEIFQNFRIQCLRKLLFIVFLERYCSFCLPINIAFNNGRCTLRSMITEQLNISSGSKRHLKQNKYHNGCM